MTFAGSFWKHPPVSRKVVRAKKRRARANAETKEKMAVRVRDRRCRFPLCGCHRFGLRLEVSHQQHKGIGGNPKGDRSVAAQMVLVCAARHRENAISLDRGTLRWRGLTPVGADGPIVWEADAHALFKPMYSGVPKEARWAELAREDTDFTLQPLTDRQRAVLVDLATMER